MDYAARMRFRQHLARSEADYRIGHVGSVEFFTSRCAFGDSSMVVSRFPIRGDRTGPDFVLVHGIGVSARSYGPTAVALAEHGDVYLVDLPGYGRSPRPRKGFGIADHARILGRFLEQTGLDHPVVVGHSMGTQVVVQLAADFPAEVDHIGLIAPVIHPEARSLPRAASLLLRDGLREPPLVTAMAVNDYLFRAGIPYMIEQTPHLMRAEVEKVARHVPAKTLVICGEDDVIVPVHWGRELADLFDHGWFVTVPGPHVAMFSAPELIARYLDEHAHR